MKISEMDTDTTYLLCPDPQCKLFYQCGKFLCENDCPRQKDLIKIIKCFSCGGLIELPGDHAWMLRVDCKCGANSFARMSGRYQIVYEKPENL